MDIIAEVARGLVALHKRSPMAALTTTRWLVTTTPATARGVAVTYAGIIALPIRAIRDMGGGGEVQFGIWNETTGEPVDIDQAAPSSATIARMVTYLAYGDPGGAEACWDALVAGATRWQVVETLAKLTCFAAEHHPTPYRVVN